MKKEEKKYTLTCTESQLWMIADAVEDWHRFLAGQCELENATSFVNPADAMHDVRKVLGEQVRPFIVPELKYRGSAYDWSGCGCPNKHQRKAIAMSYMIYRQVCHFFARQRDLEWNVYHSETLTCDEQGPLITIKEVKE